MTTTSLKFERKILSVFSMHFLISTGWYGVNLEWIENLNYGKYNGCNFINKNECSDPIT